MYALLSRFIPYDRISVNEPMAKHTSFKIGGSADVYVQPAYKDELVQIIDECRSNNAPFVILGNGSNVLIPDEGLRKVVIQLYPHFSECWIDESGKYIFAEAGAPLSTLAYLACQEGMAGLEFASGIPGTVGGAICMNAGAYDHDMAEVCVLVDLLMPNGELVSLLGEQMNFGYRSSILQQNGGIVLCAGFALSPGDKHEIERDMAELNRRRRETQPLEYPSVGSTFKRPQGHFTGKLISDCGLKGFSIGGAQVSEKHAGFVINTGDATAKDVISLIEHIQETVKDRYDVILEPEVKILCNS